MKSISWLTVNPALSPVVYLSVFIYAHTRSCTQSYIVHFHTPGFLTTRIASKSLRFMMTSSNGNIFRVTGHLCGEFTGSRWIPHTKASDAELWFFYLRLNKRLSKQSWGWWFETLSCPLWRHCNVLKKYWLSHCPSDYSECVCLSASYGLYAGWCPVLETVFRITGPFMRGIHRSPLSSPHKGPIMQWSWREVSLIWNSLQWCHNQRDDVPNHQRLDCLLDCLFRRRSKKTSKLCVTDLCEGNHWWPVDYLTKGQ